MARIHQEKSFDHDADAMWERIGEFHGIADWHPAIHSQTSEGGDRVRELNLGEAGTVVETLIDEAPRSYSYRIDESPLPVAEYTATISVRPDGSGCVVEWEADFEAAGAPDAQADEVITGIFTSGLGAL